MIVWISRVGLFSIDAVLYTSNSSVSYTSHNPSNTDELIVDGISNDLPTFFTHYDRTHYSKDNLYYTDSIDIYWSNVSPSYSDLTMLDPCQIANVDTITFDYYKGVKQ